MPKYWGSTPRSPAERMLRAFLAELRQEAGLTQRGLGARLDLPRSYVSKIERGERRVTQIECLVWARACDVTPTAYCSRLIKKLESVRW